MDAAYLHLVVNHFPIVLAIAGTVAALLALALQRRGLWVYAAASLTMAAVGMPRRLPASRSCVARAARGAVDRGSATTAIRPVPARAETR